MATTTTTTSILSTPQAGDDYYSYTESDVVANDNILVLDVMSNDSGGKSKTLYAIEASEEFIDALKAQDATGEAYAQYFDGVKVWIEGGMIMVDVSGADALAALGAQSIEDLDAGQQLDLSFAYTIQLGNGTLSVATVSLTIMGESTPEITGTDGDDQLAGTFGNDIILAGAGNDVVDGGDGDDQIDGGDGYDILHGGGGNDTLISGPGGGILDGGAGSDTLVGGEGCEAFVFDSVPSNPPVLLLGTMSSEPMTFSLMAVATEPVPMDTSEVDTVVGFNAGVGEAATWDRFVLKGDSFADLAVGANGVLAAASFETYDSSMSEPPPVGDYARILLDTAQNALFYQPIDGEPVKFAQLEGLEGVVDATDFAVIATSAHVVETNAVVQAGGLLGVGQTYEAVSEPGTGGGTFSISADGAWTYQGTSAHDDLAAGQVFTDTFTLADGTELRVDVTGTNDSAVVTQNPTVTFDEDQTWTPSGQVTATDVDDGRAGDTQFMAQSGIVGVSPTGGTSYGTFSITQTGQWFFNKTSAVNQLAFGETGENYAVVKTEDGTEVTLRVKITGANDTAFIGGGLYATISEDTPTPTVTVSVFDIDSPNTLSVNSSMEGQYGTFTFVPGAQEHTYEWTYTPNASAQALAQGMSVQDSLQIVSADGSAVSSIVVTINGADDLARIVTQGEQDTSVIANSDNTTAGGFLVLEDVDGGSSFLMPSDLQGQFGQFGFNVDTGQWTYVLDSAKASTIAAGATAQDLLTVEAYGGNSYTIVVDVNGAHEPVAPVINTTTAHVAAGWPIANVGGDLSADGFTAGPTLFSVPTSLQGTYGSFEFQADGSWRYTLDNESDAVKSLLQAFPSDPSQAQDRLVVTSADGSVAEEIVVSIHTVGELGGGTVDGTLGNDELNSNGGIATLSGDAGDDFLGSYGGSTALPGTLYTLLDGGAGHDHLQGVGAALDVFSFSTDLNASTNIDLVTDFGPQYSEDPKDYFLLDGSVFTGLDVLPDGTLAAGSFATYASPDDVLVSEASEARVFAVASTTDLVREDLLTPGTQLTFSDHIDLYYDPTGGETSDAIQFASVIPGILGLTLQASDFRITGIFGTGGEDTMIGTDGDDVLSALGGADIVDGGNGNDVLAGGGGTDILSGGAGNDILRGGVGDDLLDGGDGNDRLIGGPGSDELVGGLGDDRFIFDELAGGLVSDIDTLSDFTSDGIETDLIVLSSQVFTALEADTSGQLAAGQVVTLDFASNPDGITTGAGWLVYDSINGSLYYDADGGTLDNAVQFAVLANPPAALSESNFLLA